MAWKRQDTGTSVTVDADVDLADFDEVQLLQGLIDSKWLTETEAEAIKKRAAKQEKNPVVMLDPDEMELALATDYIRFGDKSEALIHLERFLGRDWIGRLV